MRNSVVLREERLSRAWGVVSSDATLSTVEGEPVRVVYPGRRNLGPGPDFLDAVIETPAGEVRGAVEVHQRTSDWSRHGHGADPAYGAVVLHVVGRHDGAASRAPGGTQLALLELADTGSGTAEPRRFVCAENLDVSEALAETGDRRFEANVARLASAVGDAGPEGAEEVAFEEIAAALGYSRNVAPLKELAGAFPLARVRAWAGASRGAPGSALRGEALLLGGAGLLPSQRHLPARRRRDAYAETIERVWSEAKQPPVLRAYRWDHGQSRPENSPVRRVVALAHVALSWPKDGMLAALRAALVTPRVRPLAALVSLACPDGYWLTHWDFGVPARGSPGTGARIYPGGARERSTSSETPALVGPGRAADVVVNVLLPLAAAHAELTGDVVLAEAAGDAYRSSPALAENWITRLVRERAALPFGASQVRGAREQQGLIHVYERTCHALRCADCSLAPAPP